MFSMFAPLFPQQMYSYLRARSIALNIIRTILLNATPTHKLNAVDMSCDVRMFDAKVVHVVTHTHTIIANEICFMSCNCILHLAHDHVGMTVVGVFMVSSLDVTLHVPPLHCVYSTASYFVFDDKLDKHTQVFLTTNCGSHTIVSIVGAPTEVPCFKNICTIKHATFFSRRAE